MSSKQSVQFSSNHFVIYRDNSGNPASEKQLVALSQSWKRNEYNGYLSKSTRSKIVKMLNCWAESIYVHDKCQKCDELRKNRKLRFLTLTLSAKQSMIDNDVKRRLLIPFISDLKRLFHVEHYFWRAEAQKNGNIHFHLVIDAYIDKSKVNYLWDWHQWKSGITDVMPTEIKNYHSPSTRIEAIQGNEAVAGYITKYVTKDEGGRKIFGRIWGCSDGLRELVFPAVAFTQEVAEEITRVEDKHVYEVVKRDVFILHMASVLRHKCFENSWLRTEIEDVYLLNYNHLYYSPLIE